ncbi:MAG: hypothetical protein ACM3SU_03725 [Acidobacteriota bacterium]
MFRISPVPAVGIPLNRALLCPNDDTLYDSARWKACPTCQNEDRIFLSKLLGTGSAGPRYALPFTRARLAAASQG